MDESAKSQPLQQNDEDLTVEYANNTFFSPTVWDLKIIFGELAGFKRGVEWHTAITMTWAHAMLVSYYLQLNIEAFEAANGKINFPAAMIPPPPPPLTPEDQKDPAQKAKFELITEHHRRFLERLK
ncbi:MAG: hypothetical protein LAP61_14500 [Acidobacteriia bacterium]|nr:hypothetical protein [Terriglobia bacterium]